MARRAEARPPSLSLCQTAVLGADNYPAPLQIGYKVVLHSMVKTIVGTVV
jgi:hypothetical protein